MNLSAYSRLREADIRRSTSERSMAHDGKESLKFSEHRNRSKKMGPRTKIYHFCPRRAASLLSQIAFLGAELASGPICHTIEAPTGRPGDGVERRGDFDRAHATAKERLPALHWNMA